MDRKEVFDWVLETYGTEPDYPWNDWNAVLRHNDSKKWYGIIMNKNLYPPFEMGAEAKP